MCRWAGEHGNIATRHDAQGRPAKQTPAERVVMFQLIVEEVELSGGVLMPNGKRLKPLADGEQRRKNKPRTKAINPVEQSDIEAIAPL